MVEHNLYIILNLHVIFIVEYFPFAILRLYNGINYAYLHMHIIVYKCVLCRKFLNNIYFISQYLSNPLLICLLKFCLNHYYVSIWPTFDPLPFVFGKKVLENSFLQLDVQLQHYSLTLLMTNKPIDTCYYMCLIS